MRRLVTVLALLCVLLSIGPAGALAEDATPAASAEAAPDLAAMALAPEDVPAGFFDDYAEWSVPASAFSDVIGGEATPTGLKRVYQTFYANDAEGVTIHCFLFAFASPADAAAGTGLVDLALRPPLPEGTATEPDHVAEPALGDGSGVITAVTYDTRAADGPLVDIVAASFGQERLIAGISIERYAADVQIATPEEATPAAGATPVAHDEDRSLAVHLAETLEDRIAIVQNGQAPTGADPTLRDLVLPLDQLVDEDTPILGGYKSGIDLLRCGICGEENALLPFAAEALGGYTTVVVLGPLVDGEPTPPFVSIAVSAFASPEAALGVLDAIRQAPNDLPTPGPIPRGRRALAADPVIPGADAALAFLGAFDGEDPAAPDDSAGVDFVVGELLVTVDVQGGLSADEAMAVAVDLATQQAACIEAGGPCESVSRPESLP